MTDSHDVKRNAHELIDGLPPGADWDDVMYEVYVRQAMKAAEDAVSAGRTLSEAEVRARIDQRLRRAV